MRSAGAGSGTWLRDAPRLRGRPAARGTLRHEIREINPHGHGAPHTAWRSTRPLSLLLALHGRLGMHMDLARLTCCALQLFCDHIIPEFGDQRAHGCIHQGEPEEDGMRR